MQAACDPGTHFILRAAPSFPAVCPQVALKVLNHWREAVDPSFDEARFVPSTASLVEMVQVAFEDWDDKELG